MGENYHHPTWLLVLGIIVVIICAFLESQPLYQIWEVCSKKRKEGERCDQRRIAPFSVNQKF